MSLYPHWPRGALHEGGQMRHEDDEAEYQHDAQDAHEAGWRYTPGAYGGWWRKHHNEEDEYL